MKKVIYFFIFFIFIFGIAKVDVEAAGDNLEPVINGQHGLYITNVNDPITIDVIKDGLRAFDETDGEVTESIKIHTDNYTIYRNSVGTYDVVFSANDRALNFTYFTVYITVVDTTPPTISGTLTRDAYISTLIPLSTITSGVRVGDNYYEPEDIIKELVSDNYTANYNKVGTYEVLYRATDGSGNSTTKAVVITVRDDIAPVINGPFNHKKSSVINTDLSEFVSKYTATDETDGNITDKIQITSDEYTANQRIAGTWKVKLSVTDNAGNTSEVTIYIEVEDKVGPVFYIDTTKIIIDLSSEPVNINAMINQFQASNIIKEDVVIQILEDTYSSNMDKPGTYKLVLGYDDQELAIDIEVMDRLPEFEETVEEGIFKKIANFFVRIWQIVINFFRFLFYIG